VGIVDDMIGGALVFTGERSRRGYRLNRMAMSLTSAGNRARFQADEASYMRGMDLDETEIDLVRRRDWKGMLAHGGSIYLLIKVAGAVGQSLPQVGAHTAGLTLEEFHAQRGRH
jgi:protocatechuate 4,5-dioxygenase alpha subunit